MDYLNFDGWQHVLQCWNDPHDRQTRRWSCLAGSGRATWCHGGAWECQGLICSNLLNLIWCFNLVVRSSWIRVAYFNTEPFQSKVSSLVSLLNFDVNVFGLELTSLLSVITPEILAPSPKTMLTKITNWWVLFFQHEWTFARTQDVTADSFLTADHLKSLRPLLSLSLFLLTCRPLRSQRSSWASRRCWIPAIWSARCRITWASLPTSPGTTASSTGSLTVGAVCSAS